MNVRNEFLGLIDTRSNGCLSFVSCRPSFALTWLRTTGDTKRIES
jgi:hypothetical protein